MTDRPSNLDELHGRRQVRTKEERAILDFIWAYYVKYGEWLQEKVLFKKFPELVETQFGWVTRRGPPNPWSSLNNTPPPYLVDKFTMGEFSGIKPTLLGTLLSNHGERFESKLAKYLKWICAKAKSDKNFNMITAKDLVKALRIRESEAFEISLLAVLAGFAPPPVSRQTPKNWKLSLPLDMKRVLKAQDFEMFVADRAFGATLVPLPPPKGWDKFSSIEAQRYVMNGGGQPYFDEEEEEFEEEEREEANSEPGRRIKEDVLSSPKAPFIKPKKDPKGKKSTTDFGVRLLAARKARRWSRPRLATAIHAKFKNEGFKLSVVAIKKIENGDSEPSANTKVFLCAVMPELDKSIP